MTDNFFVRPAEKGDKDLLSTFLEDAHCLEHRHLDWQLPGDWLGDQPFWILGKNSTLIAALSFPASPPGIYWVRLFALLDNLRPSQTWKLLFEKAYQTILNQSGAIIASVAVQDWYLNVLKENNFSHLHDIVVMEKTGRVASPSINKTDFIICPMKFDDLQPVLDIDNACFEPIWQNSLDIIRKSYLSCAYTTLVKHKDRIIAYQMCSENHSYAHLARIAVSPTYQRSGIGNLILTDIINHFSNIGVNTISVNTQSNNQASLALYQKVGFRLTGDTFPVMTYRVD